MERLTSYKNECKREMICRHEECFMDEEHCPHVNEDICSCLQEVLEKLAEYEDLEEQNRLLKLPCAAGDKIYLPNEYVGKVIDFEIIEICIFKEEIIFIDDSENEYFINDFGKTVFLTGEEAEAALKEL